MSMIDRSQSLSTFRLPPSLLKKLAASKFDTLRDLEGLGPVELSRECSGLSREEALQVLTTIRSDLNEGENARNSVSTTASSSSSGSVPESDVVNYAERVNTVFTSGSSALTKLEEAGTLPPLVTFCQALDEILGGGIPLGRMTEFSGLPGVGKTQIGMQLAINAFIPLYYGGCEGKSIYIDTEGSFVPSRAMELVKGLVDHLKRSADEEPNAEEVPKVTEDDIASNLHFYRIHNYIEQLAFIGQLKEIVEKLNQGEEADPRGKVRCIVIDSITFHFRAVDQFGDLSGRNRLLAKMASELSDIASKYQIAVVVMNQMTMKPGHGIVPALGDIWGHHPSTRIVLEVNALESKRKAILVKSSSRPYGTAFYQILKEGIRGYD